MTYSNPGPLEFDAVIHRSDVTGASAFVTVPVDVHAAFGAKGRVPVAAQFDGVDYRGSIITTGSAPMLLVLAAIQAQLGKGPGDPLHVRLELDTAERTVELGGDVTGALGDARLLEQFRALAYSHQREYALWIDGAKQAETRERRIAKMLEMVREGKKLK